MHTLKNNEHAAYLHGFLMFVHKINPVCGKYATHTIKNMNWLKSNKSYAIRFQQLIVLLNNKNLILDFKITIPTYYLKKQPLLIYGLIMLFSN